MSVTKKEINGNIGSLTFKYNSNLRLAQNLQDLWSVQISEKTAVAALELLQTESKEQTEAKQQAKNTSPAPRYNEETGLPMPEPFRERQGLPLNSRDELTLEERQFMLMQRKAFKPISAPTELDERYDKIKFHPYRRPSQRIQKR